MKLTFTIEQMAFWTTDPNLSQLKPPFLYSGAPEVSFIAPMARRRLPPVAKVMAWLDHQLDATQLPAVYASKYAEISNTIHLVRQFSDDLSPAKFSMSVNNAIPGLLSVVMNNEAPYSVIDSMEGLLESALTEACGLLQTHQQVKVVVFEENTAEPFNELGVDEHATVLTCVIAKGSDISLSTNDPSNSADNLDKGTELKAGLLRFLTKEQSDYVRCTARKDWHWHWQ